MSRPVKIVKNHTCKKKSIQFYISFLFQSLLTTQPHKKNVSSSGVRVCLLHVLEGAKSEYRVRKTLSGQGFTVNPKNPLSKLYNPQHHNLKHYNSIAPKPY